MKKLYGGGPEIIEGGGPAPSMTSSMTEMPKSHSVEPPKRSDSHKTHERRASDAMLRSEYKIEKKIDKMNNSVTENVMSRSTPIPSSAKPSGMANESLFCYMNACVQGLLGINSLVDYTRKQGYTKVGATKTQKFWRAFNEIVTCQGTSKFTPKQLRKISSLTFSMDEQHDSHEFMRFVLSGMQDEINLTRPKKQIEFKDSNSAWEHYKKYHSSIIDELFAGQLVSRVTCKNCSHISKTFDPFLDLSLPIIPGKTKTINECYSTFAKDEDIKDSYTCEKCKVKGKATKRFAVCRFPQNLVIHLKRFQTYPKKKKIGEHIAYPLEDLKFKGYRISF
jgi:ubiquitin C-terminal hydrolase